MEEAQRAAAEYQALGQQIQGLEANLAAMEKSAMDTSQAIATLQAIEAGEARGPILIQIGAGVMVQGTFDSNLVLRAIGADTSLAGTPSEAIEDLVARRQQIHDAFESGSRRLQELVRRAQALESKLA